MSMERRIRLLHVDDEPDFLETTTLLLGRTDAEFDITTATSAKEGLQRLQEEQFDCVVSDYEMPDTDGIEFLEQVRETDPGVPFLLFTGRGSEAIASEAISAGVTDYLQKQPGADQYELLANRIKNAVEGYRAEQELEQIRDFFEEAEQLGNLGAWEFDGSGRAVWTEGTRRVHEVEESFEPTVETGIEFCHPEDRERIESAMTRAVEDGEPYDVEARLLTAEGNERWVRTRGKPIDDGPEPTVRGFIQDITERKERERRLEETNQRLRTLVSNVPLVLFVLDRNGVFTVLEGKGLENLGLAPGEIVGESIFDVYEGRNRILADTRRALDGEQVETVHEIDGGVFETTYQPIVNEETGKVEQVIGVAVDATERQQHERALAALHDATDEIVDAGSDQEVFEVLAEAGERILGFDLVAVDAARDGILEQVACNFDPEEYPHHERTSLADEDTFGARAYRQGETIVVDDIGEYDIAPADPAYRSGLTVPIGEVGVFQGISPEPGAFDETDRELAEILVEHARAKLGRLADNRRLKERSEALEQQNERLEQFTSFVSHDLRNPLNVAQLQLELAARECDSEHLEAVSSSHDRMEALIDDILVFTRKGGSVETTEPVALDSIADDCWENVDTADATLTVKTDRRIAADRRRLQQLFENLFRNAVEHATPDVSLTVGDLEDGFYVADDGPGIPAEEREQAFESGYSTSEDGTGLGLSIVREVVEAHDWAVRVTDGLDGGARFEITGVEPARER
ncbi:MAG: HTR-like protein [Halobacteriales archaeon SW_8_66_22]|nr:MAG: HTR-like protein [Halobacteriales archaeon SW_8_66_22]